MNVFCFNSKDGWIKSFRLHKFLKRLHIYSRTSSTLGPDIEVAIHRYEGTTETFVCLMGHMEEIIYEEMVEDAAEQPTGAEEGVQKDQGSAQTLALACRRAIWYTDSSRCIEYDSSHRTHRWFLKWRMELIKLNRVSGNNKRKMFKTKPLKKSPW